MRPRRSEIVHLAVSFAVPFVAVAIIATLLLFSQNRALSEAPKSLEPPEIHATTRVADIQGDDGTEGLSVTVPQGLSAGDDPRLPRPEKPTGLAFLGADTDEEEVAGELDVSLYSVPLPSALPAPELPYAVFEESAVMLSIVNGLNVRSGPGIDYATIMSLSAGQRIEVFGASEDEMWLIGAVLPGRQIGYVNRFYVATVSTGSGIGGIASIASIGSIGSIGSIASIGSIDGIGSIASDSSIEYFAMDVVETVGGKQSHLVDVRRYIPDMDYVMIFSTPDNFTGVPLYSRDACMLQLGTVQKLKKAQELFALDGYTIRVYDAYRPSAVSGMLYGIIQDTTYIARPGTSTHNRGAAVDISLVDVATGEELVMPSPMHTFNVTSNRSYSGMSAEARANMNYLTSVMVRCGFTTLSSEWWHFNDSNRAIYPALDHPISAFMYETVDLKALGDDGTEGDGFEAAQPTDDADAGEPGPDASEPGPDAGEPGPDASEPGSGTGDAGIGDAKPEDREDGDAKPEDDELLGPGGTGAG
jgi:D-alanyl-D-alanine dipeptidase